MNFTPRAEDSLHVRQPKVVTLKPSNYFDSTVIPPCITNMRSQIKPVHLSEIPAVSTQQALVIKDLLLALVGYEGNYVRYTERYQPHKLGDRIRGPDFKVAASLDISLKTVTKRLLRYGKFYVGLKNFSQIYNTPHFGRVNQRLCGEIHSFLRQYYQLVASFERAFHESPYCSLSAMDNELQNSYGNSLKHLYEITCTIHEQTEQKNPRFLSSTSVSSAISGDFMGRDPRFDTFLNSIRTDINSGVNVSSDPNAFDVCKGGLVLRIIDSRISQFEGDIKACAFLTQLFEAVSAYYVTSLNTWLAEGEVDDRFNEFLVKKNDLPKNIFYSNVERYWEELYVIKTDGLIDRFLDKDLQAKVLATGKFLNIFKRCVRKASLKNFPDNISTVPCPSMITSLSAQDLNHKILQFYDRANNLLLKLLFKGYHFGDILTCLHERYFLNNSSKIDQFLNKMLHELGKNKATASTLTLTDTFNDILKLGTETDSKIQESDPNLLSIHSKISAMLRTFQNFSIDSTNFYDLSTEIVSIRSFDAANAANGDEQASSVINRLVKQSLRQSSSIQASDSATIKNSDKNHVVAAVNIDCELPFPIGLVMSENYIFEFQLAFKLQMILKYASKVIDSAWRDTMHSTVWNYKHFPGPLKKLVSRSRVLIHRMKDFVTDLQYYVGFSVIEANYTQLKQSFRVIFASLDKPRPASRASKSTSPFKDQPLTKANNKNSIFDEKIKISANRQAPSAKFGSNMDPPDIHALSQSIATYLSNILRDTMITNSQLLLRLHTSIAIITEYTHITSRLKKTLISTDAHLLNAFARDYPGKFDKIEINETLVKNRIIGLNNVITKFWTDFNYSLKELIQDLKAASTGNSLFTALGDKLSVI